MNPVFSFVIPIFNEQETLPELVSRMKELLVKIGADSEVLLVDDGSRDNSLSQMFAVAHKDSRFKVIQLSRNFGHQIAITAGMDYARGQATIIMDADLQDPPEVVLEMIKRWKNGAEIVYGLRIERQGDSLFKRSSAKFFYSLLDKLSEIKIPNDVGDFRLIDRKALEAFKQLGEKNRYVRGMFSWVGFKQEAVEYQRSPRFAGVTKYPLRKMIKLALNGVIGFSDAPLKLVLNFGFLVSGAAFLFGIFAIYAKLSGFYIVSGLASLTVLVVFMGGIQLVVIGVLGEYVGRIHDEVKDRPLYLVSSTTGLEDG